MAVSRRGTVVWPDSLIKPKMFQYFYNNVLPEVGWRTGSEVGRVRSVPIVELVFLATLHPQDEGRTPRSSAATMGLKKRLYFYGKPGSTQRTSIRVNGLIRIELGAGKRVELIAHCGISYTLNVELSAGGSCDRP